MGREQRLWERRWLRRACATEQRVVRHERRRLVLCAAVASAAAAVATAAALTASAATVTAASATITTAIGAAYATIDTAACVATAIAAAVCRFA